MNSVVIIVNNAIPHSQKLLETFLNVLTTHTRKGSLCDVIEVKT